MLLLQDARLMPTFMSSSYIYLGPSIQVWHTPLPQGPLLWALGEEFSALLQRTQIGALLNVYFSCGFVLFSFACFVLCLLVLY